MANDGSLSRSKSLKAIFSRKKSRTLNTLEENVLPRRCVGKCRQPFVADQC